MLRAFYNACRHRGAPVTRDECGTARRLTCQYHSWSYGTDGELKAVPDARSFADLDTDALGLVPVRCEVSDGWVFVSEDPEAVPLLATSSDPSSTRCPRSTGRAMRVVGTQTHHLACNWKLMVDAFLEVYHVRTVHPDNAALLYDDQSVTVAMLPKGHSRLNVEKHEDLRDIPMVSAEYDNPSVPLLWRQTSTSFGIFPNLVVPMDTGAFTFLCMWPTERHHTELELRWYAPAWEGDEVPPDHLVRMELFETVMAQDTANMAPIQESVSSPGARPFQIGWHERLIHHFHRAVDLAIGPDDAARRERRCRTPSTASSSHDDVTTPGAVDVRRRRPRESWCWRPVARAAVTMGSPTRAARRRALRRCPQEPRTSSVGTPTSTPSPTRTS